MKLILSAGIFPPDIGGPATYAEELAGYLSRQGHQVTVICFSDKADGQKLPFQVIRTKRGLKFFSHWRYFWQLYIASRDVDCLYAQGPVAGGWQSYLVASLRHKPLAVKITGDYAWEQAVGRFGYSGTIDEFQQEQKLSWQIKILQALEKIVCRRAQLVVTPSDYLKQLMNHWGVADDRIKVVYNSFSRSFIATPQPELANVALAISRLVPWKGFEELISIWPRVLDRLPEAQLRIGGDGPEYERLAKKIDTLGLRQSVHLLGRLTPQNVVEQFSQAKIFILNSSYEGLSHLLLEALAGNVPVVATNVGGNREVITNNSNGRLIPYGDQEALIATIIELLTDEGRRQDLIKAIPNSLQKFQPEKVLAQITQELEILCSTHKAQ